MCVCMSTRVCMSSHVRSWAGPHTARAGTHCMCGNTLSPAIWTSQRRPPGRCASRPRANVWTHPPLPSVAPAALPPPAPVKEWGQHTGFLLHGAAQPSPSQKRNPPPRCPARACVQRAMRASSSATTVSWRRLGTNAPLHACKGCVWRCCQCLGCGAGAACWELPGRWGCAARCMLRPTTGRGARTCWCAPGYV